jgi:hypothetical protein
MNYSRYVPSTMISYLVTVLALPLIASAELNSTPASFSDQKIIPSSSFPCSDNSEEINIPGWSLVKRKQTWCGQVRKELRSAVPKQGYITNKADWLKLWKTYRSDEQVPLVDFAREIILVYVHTDNNNVNMSPALNKAGDLVSNISFTERGGADSPCTYIFVSIDRRGIKTIAGKAIISRHSIFRPNKA